MKKFSVNIVARDEKVYEGEAEYLLLPGWEGALGIYASHAPMITMIRPGKCMLSNGDKVKSWAMSEGFASVDGDNVIIAVSFAYTRDEICSEAAKEQLEKARRFVEEKQHCSETDVDHIMMLQAKAVLDFIAEPEKE